MIKKLKRVLEGWWPWSAYASASRLSNEILTDEDSEGWIQLQRDSKNSQEKIFENTYRDIREMSQYLTLNNFNYFGMIRTYVKYISGKAWEIKGQSEIEDKIWEKFSKDIGWKNFFKEIVFRFFQDGEVFIFLPDMIFLNPSLVQSNSSDDYGIEWDDKRRPVSYSFLQDENYVKIDAGEILHIKRSLQDEKRGLPYLFTLMTKVRNFDRWLNDRILLNRIRSSIAILRKHKKASPSQVQSFASSKQDDNWTDSYGKTWGKTTFKPGSIIDATNIEYSYLEPNIQAKDVSEDGRNIRLTFSAMTGLPEFMVSGDSSNSNYASTMVSEGPGIREFEDWIDFFKEFVIKIWHDVMIRSGLSNADDPSITIPPLVARDREKETKINQILFQNEVISLDEWRRREGVDPEQMDEEINSHLDGIEDREETEDETEEDMKDEEEK